jgi:hypothetical protein
MPFIGNQPADKFLTLEKQVFTTSATDTYTLDREVSSVNDIELFLNNVRQEPTEAYTISGTTLTLASAITASDSMYCIYQGRSVGTQAPANNTVTSAMIVDNAITSSKIASGAVANQSAYRNLIINGDMSIAQRGTSASGLTGSGYNTCDRWRLRNASLGTWTQSQSTDVPSGQGFAKSLKMDCTTADASPSASDDLRIDARLEGQNLQLLKKGTSNAESTTLSFWVKSNKTGTYTVALTDKDNSRQISNSYTINSSSTWEKKTITFDGDTTGTIDNDNNNSFEINFVLACGTNFSSGTLQTSWGSTVDANRSVGQVNLADSTSNEWYITGVQLEVGTSASDFEFLPYDVNLQRCYRYYEKDTTVYRLFTDAPSDGGSRKGHLQWKATKRATPSLTANPDAGGMDLSDRTIYGCPLKLGGAVSGSSYLPSGYIADSEL